MLPITGKRVLLIIHLLLTAVWLGALVALLTLLLISTGINDGDELAGVGRAIFALHEHIIVPASLGFVYTGLTFSLFTRWGFFRFHWVTLKWLALVLLSLVVTLVMAPAVAGMAALSDALRGAALAEPAYLRARSIVAIGGGLELVLLIAVVAVSVFKPWGQRRQRFTLGRKSAITLSAALMLGGAAYFVLQNASVQGYRSRVIPAVDLATVADGTYRGEASDTGFTYEVAVTVVDQRITAIEIVQNRSSEYTILAEGVAHKVLRAQRNDVDAVTGATTTSKVLLLAIEDALRRGREP